ncbi:hypothetical protein [Aquimarina sp. 2201CG5-10]|uniref:tetratricopeptide repeat protein n=1 Tax=Aquimarina callyspongiae TaxID=3098150 RepID=UPI002AB37809|nr:hypothetical protein [Aquimarina sp. 2201CG5-10]MDY8138110.1 hypothetical protein [Aquimarina sp. 2201CG5-10]
MKEDIQLKIERYISGSMSAEEVRLFEEQIAKDISLRDEVLLSKQINHHYKNNKNQTLSPDNQFTRDLKDFIESEESEQIKTRISSISKTYHNKNTFSRKKFLFVAATIVLLAMTTFSLILFNTDTPDELFAQYYHKEDLPSLVKRERQVSILTQGVIAFHENDFEKSAKLLQEYQTQEKNLNPSVYIYSGMAYTQLEDYDLALKEFDKMINANTIDSSKGLWFKALAYLKMNDLKNLETTLKSITSSSSNFKYLEAKELLDKL